MFIFEPFFAFTPVLRKWATRAVIEIERLSPCVPASISSNRLRPKPYKISQQYLYIKLVRFSSSSLFFLFLFFLMFFLPHLSLLSGGLFYPRFWPFSPSADIDATQRAVVLKKMDEMLEDRLGPSLYQRGRLVFFLVYKHRYSCFHSSGKSYHGSTKGGGILARTMFG